MKKQTVYTSVNLKSCKNCNICINICPKEVLDPDENGLPRVNRPDKCTACGLCASHCPDFAIEVKPIPDTKLFA
ncbi:MAG: 4Fe-4S binding protein [Desulfotomaculaceae bacterium]|nr:4Fe-4S binding protein [Desulfotomaculaceae bacterium]MDD4766741.1 4Fe-4S binding protein [Desulfotomaculaceae bacterium]